MSFDRSFALRAGPKERSRFQELRSGNSVRLPGAVIGELHFLLTQSLRDDSMAVCGVCDRARSAKIVQIRWRTLQAKYFRITIEHDTTEHQVTSVIWAGFVPRMFGDERPLLICNVISRRNTATDCNGERWSQ